VYDKRVLAKGLENMARHVNEHDGEIKKMFTSSPLLLVVNEHAAQLDRALGKCGRDYEIIIEAIINAQKGLLQPLIIAPMQIMNPTKLNEADIPSDFTLPILLSVAYHNSVLRTTEVEILLKWRYF
jgi:hypothetical protein